jgi:hypothetical protein
MPERITIDVSEPASPAASRTAIVPAIERSAAALGVLRAVGS